MNWTRPRDGKTLTVQDVFDCLLSLDPPVGRIHVHQDSGVSFDVARSDVASYSYACITVHTDEPVPNEAQDALASWKRADVLLAFESRSGVSRVMSVGAIQLKPDIFDINRSFA